LFWGQETGGGGGKVSQSLLGCGRTNIVWWAGLCILFSAMSGVKRDRDLGCKFEFDASKRKRKAELERKNLELSRSVLKFLKK
jgi:hypothetical protein